MSPRVCLVALLGSGSLVYKNITPQFVIMEKYLYICTVNGSDSGTDIIDEGVLLLSFSGNLVNFKSNVDRQSHSSLGISLRLAPEEIYRCGVLFIRSKVLPEPPGK